MTAWVTVYYICVIKKIHLQSFKTQRLPIITFLPIYTYELTTAALTIDPSPMKTLSPICNGKKATPLLNFSKKEKEMTN